MTDSSLLDLIEDAMSVRYLSKLSLAHASKVKLAPTCIEEKKGVSTDVVWSDGNIRK